MRWRKPSPQPGKVYGARLRRPDPALLIACEPEPALPEEQHLGSSASGCAAAAFPWQPEVTGEPPAWSNPTAGPGILNVENEACETDGEVWAPTYTRVAAGAKALAPLEHHHPLHVQPEYEKDESADWPPELDCRTYGASPFPDILAFPIPGAVLVHRTQHGNIPQKDAGAKNTRKPPDKMLAYPIVIS